MRAPEKLHRVLCSATLDAAAGPLPTEFRIFKSGVNESSKGVFLFDRDAASAVMARYQREGVDLIVDLEHQWADSTASARADAADARAWFKLELRNGELWAVDVKWTADGERRLREKTQRYISPMFAVDGETNRIVAVMNVALVSMPATYGAQPLVAASRRRVALPTGACKALQDALLKKITRNRKK